MNKPVAWYKKDSNDYLIENIGQPDFQVQEFIDAGYMPLYTHSAINNGGNLEELNTKVQDASTSLESTPPINTEPVGRYYWESVVDGHFMAVPSEGTIHYEIDDFPLYLHPVKELTDEEILQVMINVYSDTVPPIRGVEFARAILRKASEK